MRWADNLYVSDACKKKKEKIIKKANSGRGMLSIYFIAIPENPENLLEIFHGALLKQPLFYEQNPYIVGISNSYDEALELLQTILMDIYSNTNSFSVRPFFGMKDEEEA